MYTYTLIYIYTLNYSNECRLFLIFRIQGTMTKTDLTQSLSVSCRHQIICLQRVFTDNKRLTLKINNITITKKHTWKMLEHFNTILINIKSNN